MGFVAFGLVAMGTLEDTVWTWSMIYPVLVGACAASVLNAASNIVNQYFDLEIDSINKPHRPLPSGRISRRSALIFMGFLYVLALLLAYIVPNKEYFIIVIFTAFVTYAYSGLPFRTKRFGILANLTMAIPRGGLLVVAGWSSVRSVLTPEPWLIASVFFLYILGASTTKDYADIEGDRAHGCRTLPVIYGVRWSVYMITPFFVIPFILLIVYNLSGLLSGNWIILTILGIGLSLWGVYIAYLLLRDPRALATEANHISWKHMYLLMVVAQVGFAVAYLV
jgi:4-hydroxybenzoate polyprenyltransferase